MKLAVSTLPCKEWSLEKTLLLCKENGIKGLEMRLGLNEWSQLSMTKEQCIRVREKLAAYDMELTDLGTSVVISSYDKNALEELKNCIGLAEALETKGLRIMLGYFRELWSQTMPRIEYEGICKWLEEADRAAGDSGREIWIETHNEFATGASLKPLFTDCHLEHTGLIWDVLHPLEQGERVEDTLAFMKEKLVHVHIKDGRPWEDPDRADWHYTKIGEGIVPIEKIIRLLSETGYEGYYSLEWESLWRKELQGPACAGEKIIPQFAEYMRQQSAPDWMPL